MRAWVTFLAAMIFTIVPSVAATVAQHAVAESLSSRELYDECRKPERQDFCLGFIMGMVSSIAHETLKVNFHPFCLDWEQRPEPLVDVVLHYLEKDPEGLGKPATIHIAEALEEAFPCPAPVTSRPVSQLVLAFPVSIGNWVLSNPEDPVFLFDGVPDGFPLQEDGASGKGLFVERYGMGLQGYRTYSASVQLQLKDGSLLTTEGKIRIVGERTGPGRAIVPLMVAVGIEPVVERGDVKVLTVENIR